MNRIMLKDNEKILRAERFSPKQCSYGCSGQLEVEEMDDEDFDYGSGTGVIYALLRCPNGHELGGADNGSVPEWHRFYRKPDDDKQNPSNAAVPQPREQDSVAIVSRDHGHRWYQAERKWLRCLDCDRRWPNYGDLAPMPDCTATRLKKPSTNDSR